MELSLTINGKKMSVDVDPTTPLLWVLRDHFGLTGTKYGCGMALCGACTVHVNGQPVRSCVTPATSVQNQPITTIEGLDSPEASAISQAWQELSVVQCGYCQSGQIMSATALLKNSPAPSDADIDSFMSGNICRCATYTRIKDAIKAASKNLSAATADKYKGKQNLAEFYDAAEGRTHVG